MESLEEVRLPDNMCPVIPKKKIEIAKTEEEWFISGRIPGSWIGKASKLPGGHTLHVALAIWHVKGFKGKGNKIVLERFHLDRFGVKKDSARRALEQLREAGLIECTKTGQKYKITILPAKPETTADNRK